MNDEALREKIKKIVHGDTPDHFMSDDMLQKPDQIMALIAEDREKRESYKTSYDSLKERFASDAFKEEKGRLVKYYNVSASAKYTMQPRDDFIFSVIRAFVTLNPKKEENDGHA